MKIHANQIVAHNGCLRVDNIEITGTITKDGYYLAEKAVEYIVEDTEEGTIEDEQEVNLLDALYTLVAPIGEVTLVNGLVPVYFSDQKLLPLIYLNEAGIPKGFMRANVETKL